jgi:hypothetical protein
MSRRTVIGAALACLACCLPLLLAVAGVTTGAAGMVGYRLGRHEGLMIAVIGLVHLIAVVVGHAGGKASVRLSQPGTRTPKS